ncbi:MAG: acyl-CoA thioesterase [Alistipes sp.]|nr:acyl-CoA thioesterase [Alistipes sp.]
MITRDIQIRVRYKETDAMGVVHHSNYVTYYETARTEMLREFGTTYRALEESGIMLPVRDVTMRFFTPARYDDLLTVRISLCEMPGVRMTFYHDVLNEQGELVNTGTVVLVFMNAATRKACRAPGWFAEIFRPWFE